MGDMPEFEPRQIQAEGEVSGGRLAAAALRAGGVDTLFALCGGHILSLLDGCPDEGIRIIDVRHESAASLAAEGWALATGRTGVAAVTAGPGFANALVGLIDAGVWTVPTLLLAGRTGTHQAGRGAVMDVDQLSIAERVTKWSASCRDTSRIGAYVIGALHHARSGRPGATYLEVPQDVLSAAAAPSPMLPIPASYPAADERDITRAVAMLERAERPLIIAGGGAFWSQASEALSSFAEAAQIPVTTTSSARGLIPDSHPLCLGSLIHGGIAALAADVIVVLGSRFDANLAFGGAPLFTPGQRVIQVDIDPGSFGLNRSPNVALCGDAASVLSDMTDAWTKTPGTRQAWLVQAHELAAHGRAAWDSQIDNAPSGDGVHAGALARAAATVAREVCGDAVTFVADGGDMLTWGLAYAYADRPGRLLSTTTALGTLGVGMPFSVAAAAARPGEPVLLMTGDGAFGLTAMEVDTAVRHGLPVIALVSNNRGWGDVAHEQRAWHGREVASALADTRYDRLGEALGAHGYHAETLDQATDAIRAALQAREPAVINVRTDPEVLSDLLRNLASLNLM